MDFFEEQHRARRGTTRLVILYGVAVLGLVAALSVAASIAYLMSLPEFEPETVEIPVEVFLLSAAGVLLVVGGGSLWKVSRLSRGGGAVVAREMGGRLVDRGTTDPKERRLLNVVDETAIAAGIAAPAVYILEEERGLNAFAAGFTQSDSVVAVTRGLLDSMSRDELQGVIAHEISHVVNGDMRLNMRLAGILFGILLIAYLGRVALRAGARARGRNAAPGIIIGLGLVVAGYTGVLCGRLIQSAVSRQREYLADAAAVQFTRNPLGIGGALARIATAKEHGRLNTAHAVDAGHFLFASGVSQWIGLMSTHPPLPRRIDRILPGGRGQRLLEDYKAGRTPQTAAESAGKAQAATAPKAAAPKPAAAPHFDPWRFATGVGVLAAGGLEQARDMRQSLPEGLTTALRTPEGARRIVLALVLDENAASRRRQDALLGDEAAKVGAMADALATLPAPQRLDVLHIAAPALRQMDKAACPAFLDRLRALVNTDRRTDALEVAVLVIVERLLLPPDDGGPWGSRPPDTATARAQAVGLLSVLARAGAPGDADAQRAAFAAAVAASGLFGDAPAPAVPDIADPAALPVALRSLARMAPLERRGLIAACAAAISHNGTVSDDEALLLRAACEALEVPVPPDLIPMVAGLGLTVPDVLPLGA